jgi:DNA-directed RNA polymerase subunit RPC12/RpoP
MGLRCSILGHTFDETEVRRDRRERGSGNEVVTVVAQVERCSRCGAERVVSENKEVVSVVDADEVGLEAGENAGPGAAASESGGGVPDGAAADDTGGRDTTEGADGSDDLHSALAADEADPGGDPGGPTGPGGESEPPAETDADTTADPSEEDVEFITETEGSLGGGEDVAEDADVPNDAGDAPGEESGGGIGRMAARSGAFDGDETGSAGNEGETGDAGDDAEILDAPESESERAPGQWPDEPDGSQPWEPDTLDEREADPDAAVGSDPDVEPVADSSFTVPEGSFRCPNCGHEVSADSSFRAGDACPECQAGYLESGDQ